MQELRELKMPKASPGCSGGNCQEEAKLKEVEKEEEEEVRKMKNEVMHAIFTSGPIDSIARGDVAAVVQESNAKRDSGDDAV